MPEEAEVPLVLNVREGKRERVGEVLKSTSVTRGWERSSEGALAWEDLGRIQRSQPAGRGHHDFKHTCGRFSVMGRGVKAVGAYVLGKKGRMRLR